MRSLYRPDGTSGKGIAQYDIGNFQYVRLPISKNGGNFPEYSGTGVYVLGADYPVNFALTERDTGAFRSFVAKGGLYVGSPFSGISYGGATFGPAPGTAAEQFVDLVICKNGAVYSEDGAPGAIVSPDCFAIVTNTAATLEGLAPIPPGARILKSLQINFGATTATHASVSLRAFGLQAYNRPTLTDPRNRVQYNSVSTSEAFGPISNPAPGRFVASFQNLPLYMGTQTLAFRLEGTGLSFTNFALFSVFE